MDVIKSSKYINIAEPYMGAEEWNALKEPLETGWLTQGPKVKEFEAAFAARHKVKYAYAVTSCTTALHLALAALNIRRGDLVIVPSFTWIATVNAVEYCGAQPIFCDSDADTYNIDVAKLVRIIEDLQSRKMKPKAIIAVHLFGLLANMGDICVLAKKYGIKIVEDAACAAGASYMETPSGGFGDIACFSFHPRKVITTGEGGMCTTNDSVLAERLACLRSHGASLSEEQRHHSNRPYLMPDFNVVGYNYRMSDLQGAVGCVQVGRLDALIAERRTWAKWYNDKLKDFQWIKTPVEPVGYGHSYQAYVCLVKSDQARIKRNDVMQILHENGIGSRPGTHAVHTLAYYAGKYKLRPHDYLVATRLYDNTIALPLHNKMKKEDYERIIGCLKKIG